MTDCCRFTQAIYLSTLINSERWVGEKRLSKPDLKNIQTKGVYDCTHSYSLSVPFPRFPLDLPA